MHELYLNYLGCKGDWSKCSLVLTVSKINATDTVEMFEYWTRATMIEKLGDAELADDLIARHTIAESKLPLARKGRFIKKMLNSSQVKCLLIPFVIMILRTLI